MLSGQFYNCFNPRPLNSDTSKNHTTPKNPTDSYATVTSPFTVDIKALCSTGDYKVKTILLTLKTANPIRKRALQPPKHGIPKNTLIGKPIHCSNQAYCTYKGFENCLLTLQTFGCDKKSLPTATFAKMTTETLETILKTEGYEIVNKQGFLRALKNCGLSKAEIWRIITPYLPENETQKKYLTKRKKRIKYPVSQNALEKFTKANGYEVVRTQGICAAARASELSRVTVRLLMREHPPQEPYIRTNWAHRKTGEYTNKKRLSTSIRPKTLERFIKGNGYEIATTQGMGAAASACGIHICSVAKILYHFSTMTSQQQAKGGKQKQPN